MATTKQWMRFFLDAGIPPDSAAHYAVTFEQNRMGLDMVGDLDKEYLRDLKITALGDIISILRAAKKHQDKTEREAAVAKRQQVSQLMLLMLLLLFGVDILSQLFIEHLCALFFMSHTLHRSWTLATTLHYRLFLKVSPPDRQARWSTRRT